MPQFVPVVIGVASTAAAAGATVAGSLLATTVLGTSLTLGTALSVGLTIVGGVLQFVLNKAGRPATPRPRPQELQTTLADPTRPRWFDFGRVQRGGSLVFWDKGEDTGSGQVLWRVIVTDCQENDAIESQLLNNEPLTLDSSGFVTAPTKWASSRVRVLNKLGQASQVYLSEIESDIPNWDNAKRGDGLCYTAIRQAPVDGASVNGFEIYPNGANGEQFNEIARAAKDVYDPRDASTGWTRNAVLNIMWMLRHPQFGGLELSDFSLETWKAAATEAERSYIDGDGVAQLQYALSGRISAPAPDRRAVEVAETLRDALVAIDAVVYDDPNNDGKLAIRVGVNVEDPRPPLTIDQVISFQDESDPVLSARYDAVRVRYTEPNLLYQENITPAYGLKAGVTGWITDASALNVLTVPLQDIDRLDHAMRIAKKIYLRQAAQKATCELNIAGLLYSVGDPISFDLPHINDTGVWRVTDREINMSGGDGTVVIACEKVDTARYMAWDRDTESIATPQPAALSSGSVVDAPSCLRAAATSGGMVRVAWDPPSDGQNNTPIELDVSATGTATYDSNFSQNPQSDNVNSVELDTSGESTNIDIRARFGSAGNYGQYAEITNIDRSATVSAQAAPTLTFVSRDRNDVTFTVTPAADASNWKIELYEDNNLIRSVYACDNSTKTIVHGFSASSGGTYRVVTARVVNLSGNSSASSAPYNLYIETGSEA